MSREALPTEELESKTAQEILKYTLEKYQDRVALACSFGAEDVVLIDMLSKISPQSTVHGYLLLIQEGFIRRLMM